MTFGVESLDFFTNGELFRVDVIGCMDENNLDYDPDANISDGDKCGGCIQGFTRIGESSFTCQEVNSKYIDCKTAEVFWKLKSDFEYKPPKDTPNCAWWNFGRQCYGLRVPAIGNDGVIYITRYSSMHVPHLVQWHHKRQDIESECGSIDELPVTPEEVPNFLPAPSTPPISQNDTDTDAEAEPAGANWFLIGGLAVGAFLLMG